MTCNFCHREGMPCVSSDIDETFLLDTVSKMYGLGFRKFKLMGGEPMLYPNLQSAVVGLRERIEDSDLSMITNGMAEPCKYESLLSIGLNRLNISIHGWGRSQFLTNTGSSEKVWARIHETVDALADKRLLGKLNYVVKKSVNEEDFFDLIDYAGENKLVVDALNLLDVGNTVPINRQHYSMADIERLVRSRFVVRSVLDVQNQFSLPSKRLKLENGAIVNLKVTELNREMVFHSCLECRARAACIEGIKAIRLTPSGIIQPCLMRTDNGLDLNIHHDKADISAYLAAL